MGILMAMADRASEVLSVTLTKQDSVTVSFSVNKMVLGTLGTCGILFCLVIVAWRMNLGTHLHNLIMHLSGKVTKVNVMPWTSLQ